MKDIFTSFDDDNDDKISKRISFDNNEPDEGNDIFTFDENHFEDFDTGREVTIQNNVNTPISDSDYSFDDFDSFLSDFSDSKLTEEESYELPHESTADEFEKPHIVRVEHKAKKEKKTVSPKIIVSAIICLVVILLVSAVGFAYSLCSKPDYKPDSHVKNEFISDSELMNSKDVYNVLVLGTDKRKNQDSFRSDSMILVSLDKKHHKVKLTSFLRDSYVYIPAKGFSTKLNASCSYGGPQMVIDTIEYNFKVKIDKYVMIDFNIFRSIIRDLGGVELTVTEEEAACIKRESGRDCASGTNTYDARTALWYARIRHLDSDFKRTERQRKVIAATVNKMKKSSLSTLIKMFNNSLPLIQTDLSQNELFKLGLTALPFLAYDIEEMEVPVKGTWSNAYVYGQAVLKLDIEKNTSLVKEFIYE